MFPLLLRSAVCFVFVLAATPARADLRMSFDGGRVTIEATNVPLRQILAEWARLGRTRIDGLEGVSGQPLTLTLTDEPEARALEVLLRPLAGYMAAPRRAPAHGASVYDRVLLLPTSVASAAPPAVQRRPPPLLQPPPAPFPDPTALANEEPGDASDGPAEIPVFDPDGNARRRRALPPQLGDPNQQALPDPPGGIPLQPPQEPVDPDAPPDAAGEGPATEPALPLTSPRPGVLPLPKQQQARPRP
jgi:hypothetical protein